MRLRSVIFGFGALAALAACTNGGLETGVRDEVRTAATGRSHAALIHDASKAGVAEGLYFLPPIVATAPDRGALGALAADLMPSVRIDEIEPSSGTRTRTVTRIERGKNPGDGISVDGEGFHANWKAKDFALDPSKRYRATVVLDERDIGSFDVALTGDRPKTGAIDATDAELVVIRSNQTLSIKFWLNACAPVVCTARDACHAAGRCDPSTAACTSPVKEACAVCETLANCHIGSSGPVFVTGDPEIAGAALAIPPDAPPADVAIAGDYAVAIGESLPRGASTYSTSASIPGDQLTTVGHAVSFLDSRSPPSGLVFAPGACATMTMPFRPEGLLRGVSPTESVRIYQILDGHLEMVPGPQTVDVASGTVTACVAHLSEYVTAQAGPARGFYTPSAIWPSSTIPVCWEDTDPAFATERGWVRDQIARTWEAQSRLSFVGWGQCTATSRGIRIKPEDRPLTQAEIDARDLTGNSPNSGVGTAMDGVRDGMHLNFTWNYFAQRCQAHKEECIRVEATHEFGHAIGLLHEQDRKDSTCTTGIDKDSQNAMGIYGSYDATSVMNYCFFGNSGLASSGFLSPGDIALVRALYGAPEGMDLFFTKRIDVGGGLFGASGNVTFGGTCPASLTPPTCDVTAKSSTGNCYVVGWANPNDANDCRCIVHYGVPALQGVSCIAEIHGTPPVPVCGGSGDPCCAGACNTGLVCNAGTCGPPPCGGANEMCCSSTPQCAVGLSCTSGNICVAPTPTPTPTPAPTCGVLRVNEVLHPYDQISSCDGRFHLIMQGDGNLVLHEGETPIWHSNTWRYPGAYAWMQGDGNLVVYAPGEVPVWSSKTYGFYGAELALQDDGNAVVYWRSNPIWASNTCCR